MINFVFMLTHSDSTIPGAIDYVEPLAATGLRYTRFQGCRGRPADTSARSRRWPRTPAWRRCSGRLGQPRGRGAIGPGCAGRRSRLDPRRYEPGRRPALLEGADVRYCPFPGRVVGHPSVLEGSIEEIAASAATLTARPGRLRARPVSAYRHSTADIADLTRAVVDASAGPVIAAGSVTSAEQIDTLAAAGAWASPSGSAIFDGLLPGAPDVAAQVRAVLALAAAAPGAADR